LRRLLRRKPVRQKLDCFYFWLNFQAAVIRNRRRRVLSWPRDRRIWSCDHRLESTQNFKYNRCHFRSPD
jgi:hypothetical protein